MDTIYEWQRITVSAFTQIGEQLSSGLINLIGALIVLLIGWLITKLVVFLLKKLLVATRINKLTEKISKMEWFRNNMKIDLVYIITLFVKWILYLIFIVIAAEIMQWQAISNEISGLFAYLPNLFVAIALFLVGLYIADFVRKALHGVMYSMNLAGARTFSSIAFYVIMIIFVITALNQAKIDTSIITSNILIIMSGAVLILVIGLGVGSIDTVKKFMSAYFLRKRFNVGNSIKMGDLKGKIKSIDTTGVSIETSDKKEVFVPVKEFTDNQVEIMS